MVATGPAVVLGSGQAEDVVDRGAAAAAGIEVARRRSGGGAVWVSDDAIAWIDVVVPRSSALWTDDVIAAFTPVGTAVAAALTGLDPPGLAGESLWVHEGRLDQRRHADLICFAGTGPGEVFVGPHHVPAKVVGISQRRRRDGARFQCAICRSWDAEPLRSVLMAPPPSAQLAALGRGVGAIDGDELAAAVAVALDRAERTASTERPSSMRGDVDLR